MSRPRREVQPHLVPLGDALRRARETARPELKQTGLSDALGWGQTKVSLIEAGRQTPTEADVVAWAEATGAESGELLEAREAALTRRLDIREAARRPGGANVLQGDLANLESTSGTIAEYQPTLIPGLAQTPDYTRAWINSPARVELGDPPDVDELVADRAARQRAAARSRIVAVVTPWVLTAVYGSVQTQRAQLDALITAVNAGTLELVVAHKPIALLHGFELLDDAVVIETVAEATVMAHADVLVQFRRALTQLRSGGVSGAPAVREVEQARDSL